MLRMPNRLRTHAVLALLAGSLSACSVLDGDKVDYKTASRGVSLEVPPDLTQLSRDTRYAAGAPVSASAYQATRPDNASIPTAATTVGDVRIERDGNQRWLVINRTPDQLWGPVREFWQENGFLLSTDQQNIGVMETDWAENRAKLPQDAVRSALGRVFDGLYSTGERDRFRTRFERTASGGTEIYISHRGMQEVNKTSQFADGTIWQPRPADPGLEAEFLRRLMIKLGVSAEQAKTAVANAPARQAARLTTLNNQPAVQIDENFDRAWRRVGLALDRTGFTVEDRDRAKGLYFVRYVEPTDRKADSGGTFSFLNRLFSPSTSDIKPVQYRILLQGTGETANVTVLNANGTPETSTVAQKILQLLADDLR